MGDSDDRLLSAAEWRRTWRTSSSETRRRIRRAYWRGEALEDPQLAALAVGYAESARPRPAASFTLTERAAWSLALVVGVISLLALLPTLSDAGRIAVGLLYLLLAATVVVLVPRLERGSRQVAAVNREVIERLAGAPADEAIPRLLIARRLRETTERAIVPDD